jgi:hypothetical protein
MVVGMARWVGRMKGQGIPMWTYLVLAVTLILVAVFASPFYQTLEFAKSNNARLEAQSIAGIINMIKSSSSVNFNYEKGLAKSCDVEINDFFVNVTVKTGDQQTSYISNIIQNLVKVEPVEINCEFQRTIRFVKRGNALAVEGI